MRINLSNVSLNIEEYNHNSSAKDYIFFLHGFTGSLHDWDEIIPALNNNFHIIAIDLIGHGKSDLPEDVSYYSTESIIGQIHQVILYFTNNAVIVAGYSMGGRGALSFASKYPEMVKGLILESASAGILEESLRKERVEQDEKLAEFIEAHHIEEFIDYWINISLFNSQKNLPKEKLESIKKIKLENSKTGLANSLRGFGTGMMPPLFNDIKKIAARTILISGELDLKYTAINSGLVNNFPSANHIIIKNAGHNAHLEQPSSFINVINDFLNKY